MYSSNVSYSYLCIPSLNPLIRSPGECSSFTQKRHFFVITISTSMRQTFSSYKQNWKLALYIHFSIRMQKRFNCRTNFVSIQIETFTVVLHSCWRIGKILGSSMKFSKQLVSSSVSLKQRYVSYVLQSLLTFIWH